MTGLFVGFWAGSLPGAWLIDSVTLVVTIVMVVDGCFAVCVGLGCWLLNGR